MFVIFANLVHSLVYGVDAGTDRMRISVAAKGGEFSIQPTSSNRRSNWNAVALDDHWYIGDDVMAVAARNESLVVENPCQYLTHPEDFPIKGVHPVEACAINIAGNIPNFVPKNDRIIGVVPTTATPQYRYAFVDAIAAANSMDPVIIEQSSAVATSYILERLNRTQKGNHDIMFVDIGAKQTEISHWRFNTVNTLTTAELVNFRASDKVSGRVADKAIVKYIMKFINKTEFEEKEMKHLELLAKTAKEEMNSGFNVTVNLKKEYNVTVELTEEVAEELFKEMTDTLSVMLKSFKTPDSIELVGGSSRLSVINKTVSTAFEEIPVKKSLNCEEAAVLGAAYFEALRTKIFYGLKIQINKTSLFGFTVEKQGRTRDLIQPGSLLKPRLLSFIEGENFPFSLLTSCSDAVRAKVDTEEITNMKKELITVDNLLDKIISTNEGRLGDEKFVINATFDLVSSLETYGLMSIKASNKIRGKRKVWSVDTDIRLTDPALSATDAQLRSVRAAVAFFKSPKSKPTAADRLNQLLAMMRRRLLYDSDMQIVTTPDERANLTTFLNEVEKNMTEAKSPRVLKILLPKVERKLRSPLLRADERKDRPGALDNLQTAIERAAEAIEKATTDERAIERFKEYFEITKLWKQVAEEVDRFTNPVITCKDIIRRANTLAGKIPDLFAPKRVVTHFKTAPPLTPPPEPAANETETNTTASTSPVTEETNSTVTEEL